MTLTEMLVNAMPPIDVMQLFSEAERWSIRFLFFYLPVLACGLAAIKGLQFIYNGLRLLHMTKGGKYVRGKVIGKYREEGEFFETGRCFLFTYPVVQYKHMDQLKTCIANKPQRKKNGKIMHVYVCSDGDEHLRTPGVWTIIFGLTIIALGVIGITVMYNSFNIFA